MSNLLEWRKEFPVLDRTLYLNSCSLGAVPRTVPDSQKRFYDLWATQGTKAWESWFSDLMDLRRDISTFIGAEFRETAITYSVAAAMTSVASALDFKGKRNKVVFSECEFPSSAHVWQKWEGLGAKVEIVPARKDGQSVDLEAWKNAIDKRTLIVPTSHVFFRSGCLQDAKALAEICHDAGALFFLDDYQSLGIVPHDLHDIGCDFATGGLLKWCCGGPGVVMFYASDEMIRKYEPRAMGWLATKDPFAFKLRGWEHAPDAWRFTYGTPPVAAAYTTRPGFDIIRKIGVAEIKERVDGLSTHFAKRALAEGWKLFSPVDASKRSGIVTFDFPKSEEVCSVLLDRNVIVDHRPGAGIRVSPHFYNTREELDRFVDEVNRARQDLKSGKVKARSPHPMDAHGD